MAGLVRWSEWSDVSGCQIGGVDTKSDVVYFTRRFYLGPIWGLAGGGLFPFSLLVRG